MDIGNLASGLIGAIIGSIIGALATYKAAIKGAKVSIEETSKVETRRQKGLDENFRKQIIRYLNEELESNLELTKNIQISRAKIRFLDKAFENTRVNARLMPQDLFEILRPLYVEIWRFNVLADYDQEKVPWGGGYLDDALVKQGEVIKTKIEDVKSKLKTN